MVVSDFYEEELWLVGAFVSGEKGGNDILTGEQDMLHGFQEVRCCMCRIFIPAHTGGLILWRKWWREGLLW